MDQLVSGNHQTVLELQKKLELETQVCVSRGREDSEAEEGTREHGQGGGLGGDLLNQADGRVPRDCGGMAQTKGRQQAGFSTENLKQYRTHQSHTALHRHHAILNSVSGKRCLQPERTLPASPHQLPTHGGVGNTLPASLKEHPTAHSTRRLSLKWLCFLLWTMGGTQPTILFFALAARMLWEVTVC